MYYLKKIVTISAGHHLKNYNGICKNPHGHNWIVTVYCKGNKLDETDMLVDFTKISQIVKLLDHIDLNPTACKNCGHQESSGLEYFQKINPTAESIAKWLCNQIPHCYKVSVEETEGSVCTYVKDLICSEAQEEFE